MPPPPRSSQGYIRHHRYHAWSSFLKQCRTIQWTTVNPLTVSGKFWLGLHYLGLPGNTVQYFMQKLGELIVTLDSDILILMLQNSCLKTKKVNCFLRFNLKSYFSHSSVQKQDFYVLTLHESDCIYHNSLEIQF